MHRHYWLLSSLLIVVAAVSVGLTTLWFNQTRPVSQITATQSQPLILVPGSDGTTAAFDPLLKKVTQQTTAHPILKLTVCKNNRIRLDQKPATTDLTQALIVIGFENNADGIANVKLQARQFTLATTYLHQHYHLGTANALGYSNGGLIITRYLVNLAGRQAIQIKHLMLFGTPFAGTDAQHPDRELLQPTLDAKKSLAPALTVTNVAGNSTKKSDGIVPVESVHAGRAIFQHQIHQYLELTINSGQILHETFPSNATAIHLVRQLLLFER